ncbi:MAG TPA: GIY-YIG nuclease family protein, partial [Nitrospirae bacterium]|nr:GIY-YIG nuclease family protein [Nitrospirota bacterium]
MVSLSNHGSYYTGVTNDVERRFYEHQEGLIEGCYTH